MAHRLRAPIYLIGFWKQGTRRPSKPASGLTRRPARSPRSIGVKQQGAGAPLRRELWLQRQIGRLLHTFYIIAQSKDVAQRAASFGRTSTPTATSFCTVVEELGPPQANTESNPFLACNAVKMDKKDGEDAEVQPDPHDGGSMRGEKMVSSPSRRHIGTQTSHVTQRRCAP